MFIFKQLNFIIIKNYSLLLLKIKLLLINNFIYILSSLVKELIGTNHL